MNDNGFSKACQSGNHMTEDSIWPEQEKLEEEGEKMKTTIHKIASQQDKIKELLSKIRQQCIAIALERGYSIQEVERKLKRIEGKYEKSPC